MLASQCLAFSINKKGNFEEFLEFPQKVKTYHSRCLNHQIQQSVLDTVYHFPWIEQLEHQILEHINIINKNEENKKIMHGRGPTDIQTRWLWRVEVIDFLRRNYEGYRRIFGIKSITLFDLRMYGLTFEGVIGLHRIYESESVSLPLVFSIDLQYFFYVHNLLSLKIFCFLLYKIMLDIDKNIIPDNWKQVILFLSDSIFSRRLGSGFFFIFLIIFCFKKTKDIICKLHIIAIMDFNM